MSNTYTPGDLAKTLARVGVSALQSRLAPLTKFCRVIGIEASDLSMLDSVVPLATTPCATRIYVRGDATDFADYSATLTGVQFTHKLYVQAFGLSNNDLQSGGWSAWTSLAEQAAHKLGETLTDAVATLLTTANFGTAAVTVQPSSFGQADFDTLVASLASPERAVVLDSAYWSRVKSTWLPVGFNSVYEMGRWTAAGTNVRGFIADPRAIVARAAIPLLPTLANGPAIFRELIQIPELGLVATADVWFGLQGRTIQGAICLIFAPAVGDANALKLLVSA
jgi:hypothetical protein